MAKRKLDSSALAHLKIAAIGPATKSGDREARTDGDGDAERIRCRIGGRFAAHAREREARVAGAREGRTRRDSARAAQSWSDGRCDRSLRNGCAEASKRALASGARWKAQTACDYVYQFFDGEELRCACLGLRSARAALKKSAPNHGVHSASIGPVTSATLREFGLPVDIEAKQFDIPGLVAAIVTLSKHHPLNNPYCCRLSLFALCFSLKKQLRK